jgi:hypothetical protein
VNENVFNRKKWIWGRHWVETVAPSGFCILETVFTSGSTHDGLIWLVLVDKKMDRFDLEESLYAILIFPFLYPLK